MEGINTMPRDEYYRRLGVAIGKLGNRLLRKGDEYDSLCRKHEDLGRNDEAMDAFFMYIAFETAHYGMIKRFEEIRAKGIGQPLFTLTAEEVENLKPLVEKIVSRTAEGGSIITLIPNDDFKSFMKNLLNRINQWHKKKDF